MKLVGALRLCACHQATDVRRQAVLIQDGYSFLVKQRGEHPEEEEEEWQSGCALEIRVQRMVLSQGALAREPVLMGETFTLLSDCLFHLSHVYGIADGGWVPFPYEVGIPPRRAASSEIGEAA